MKNVSQIEESKKSGIRIHPNPVRNELVITGKISYRFLSVYNVQGQKKLEFHIDNQNIINSCDVSSLADGIYFLKSGSNTLKFIKRED